jgi:hypothetical protein
VLTGSARIAAVSEERAALEGLTQESAELARALERRRESVEAQVSALQADFGAEESLTRRLIETSERRREASQADRLTQARRRSGKPSGDGA